jgi:predicted transcriptional regulator
MKNGTSEEIAEVLEVVWTLEEQGSSTMNQLISAANISVSEDLIRRLSSQGLIAIDEGGSIHLLSED